MVSITVECDSVEDMKELMKFADPVPVVNNCPPPAPAVVRADQIEALLNATAEGKLQTIKWIREITHLGLKESKDLYERVWPYGTTSVPSGSNSSGGY